MIIAFTGAGISKESGIPTFEDTPGIRDFLERSFAKSHPEEYRKNMSNMVHNMIGKLPNDAHKALAEYHIPVISMNIDNLHEQAGTEHLLKIHGCLPTEAELDYCNELFNAPVLYGDPAPNYQIAFSVLDAMHPGDILLVVGSSGYTYFSSTFVTTAQIMGVQVHTINENAGTKVREFLEKNRTKIEDWDHFIKFSPCDSDWLNNYM